MTRIFTIQFHYLRGEAHYQYLNLFNQLLIEFPSVQNIVSVFYTEFVDLLTQEKQIVDAQKSSDYTLRIADADHRDDRLITVSAKPAITPIPKVYLEGVELFFAKDFTLTCKNNVEKGVAEMGIVGKKNRNIQYKLRTES
ncbi:MAG: hypothetical protein LBM08_12150 [Dysgonamonadaceae bacterium]|jgi:hypothetical protein|nr:hypothetical protein [Dysgonamonadaceae bacterium]